MDGLQPGRIVHYVLAPNDLSGASAKCAGIHCAALVLGLPPSGHDNDGTCNLAVFPDHPCTTAVGTCSYMPNVKYSDSGQDGTWHWPEKT